MIIESNSEHALRHSHKLFGCRLLRSEEMWMRLFLWLGAASLALPLQSQVVSNVFERVLYVRVGKGTAHEGTASAFTIEVDNRQYLITAKHVIAGLKDQDSIEIYKADKWTPLKVQIFRCDAPIDIAVLIPPYQLTPTLEMSYDQTKFMFGQEAYFLGFPYGIFMNGQNVNGDYPFPFIKRATISSTQNIDLSKKAIMVLLDGYNNPGFSGGPIVYRYYYAQGMVMKALGVVSGFIPEVVPVTKKHELKSPADASPEVKAQPWRIQQNPDKSWFEYQDSGNFVALNTGIVQGYLIAPAINVIHAHPIGPIVGKQP